MAARIIEAKAVISGEDRLSKVLDGVNKKIKTLGKGIKTSADLDRLNKQLETTKKQLAAIDKVNAAQSRVSAAKLGLTGAQTRAAEVAAALADARAAKDKTLAADLVARHKEAEKAVAQASRAMARQTAALGDARREVASFGVPISSLVAHERALKEAVDRTTAAINTETAALRRRDVQARWDARRERREAAARGAANPNFVVPIPDRKRPGKGAPAKAGGGSHESLGPLPGLVGWIGAITGYQQAAEFDRRLTMIGQTADATRDQINGLGRSLHDLGQQTATPVDKVAGGLEALVAQGRNLKEAMTFLPSVTRTAAASGAEVEDIAKTADSVGTNFKIAGKDMERAFDIMAAGGKAGQFELKDMARYLPSLGPAASAIGFEGQKGLADLVSMLQVMRKGSGTSEEAVASMNNILAKMESDKTVKNFKGLGVDLPKAFEKARKEGKNLIEVFENLVHVALKGDRSKLGDLIDDMEFKRGVQALMAYRGEWQKTSAALQSTSGGTVAKDLVRVTQDAQAKLDRLYNSWQRFIQGAASIADAGGLGKGLEGLGQEITEIATALERINKANEEGGLSKVFDQIGSDVKDRLREKRGEWLEHRKGQENGRIAELEADNKRFREKLEREGRSPAEIAKTMAVREAEVEKARRRRGAIEKAQQAPDQAPRVPLRMGVDPRDPIQGRPGEVGPGVTSFQEAYPIELARKAPKPRRVPLPPKRPIDLPSVQAHETIDSIHQVLGPGVGGASGPITAEVKSFPPLSGTLTGTVEVGGTIKTEPSPYFLTTFTGFEKRLATVEGKVGNIGSTLKAVGVGANNPGSTGKGQPESAPMSRW